MGDEQRKELLYKVLVVGDIGTGKTSIIKRYVHGIFSMHYKSTIGVDFALKVLDLNNRTTVRLQLWDIAGQERFGNMTRVYYKEAVGAFVVFDVTRISTFDAVKKWKNDIDAKVTLPGTNDPIPVVLLANKIDIVDDQTGWGKSKEEMDKFCQENGFVDWFATSAKEDIDIDKAAQKLVESILSKVSTEEPAPPAPGTIKVGTTPQANQTSGQEGGCPC
eukprot:TRINITY_DN1963_c0_g1_i1.p1 TRINITY_DN1963_c0_g1~~TRINITY_DN1963_c0_g1_i1.p1  ORF type:complete len:219 (-),score=50.07 TRINITY_DN1963_c0_g1_i1:189-845(-)